MLFRPTRSPLIRMPTNNGGGVEIGLNSIEFPYTYASPAEANSS